MISCNFENQNLLLCVGSNVVGDRKNVAKVPAAKPKPQCEIARSWEEALSHFGEVRYLGFCKEDETRGVILKGSCSNFGTLYTGQSLMRGARWGRDGGGEGCR